MKYLIKFLDIYLIGIFKVSDWFARHDGDTSTAIGWCAMFLTFFVISILNSYWLQTNMYARYVIEEGNDMIWFWGLFIFFYVSLTIYVKKIRGKELLLDGKLNLKEKFICLILVCIFVGNLIRVGDDVQAFSRKYKAESGYYERHPSKYQGKGSLEGDIRNWFKKKFGDKENNK